MPLAMITSISDWFDLFTTELLIFRAACGTMRTWKAMKSWKANSSREKLNLFRFDVMWTSLGLCCLLAYHIAMNQNEAPHKCFWGRVGWCECDSERERENNGSVHNVHRLSQFTDTNTALLHAPFGVHKSMLHTKTWTNILLFTRVYIATCIKLDEQ